MLADMKFINKDSTEILLRITETNTMCFFGNTQCLFYNIRCFIHNTYTYKKSPPFHKGGLQP